MKSLKFTYALFFLLTFNVLQAQSNTTKWRSAFTLSGGINAMTSKPITNEDNFTFSSGTFVNLNTTQTWKFHYKAGIAFGFFTRWSLGDNYALQGEANILWNRQEAELSEIPPSVADPQFAFTSIVGKKGTISFNTVYLQIPLIINRLVGAETTIEGGLFLSGAMSNKSRSRLKVTTFSGFDNITGRFTVFTPPRVADVTAEAKAATRLGWLLGVQHNINDKIAMRLRYEGSLGSNFSDFRNLREQRIWVGMAFRMNQK